MFTKSILQVWKIVCYMLYLAGKDEIVVWMKVWIFMFGLLSTKEENKQIFLTSSSWMFTQFILQVWSESEIVCYLSGKDEIVVWMKTRIFMFNWAAMPSERRIAKSSSHHGDESGWPLSLLRDWNVVCSLAGKDEIVVSIKPGFLCLDCHAICKENSQIFLTSWWWKWISTESVLQVWNELDIVCHLAGGWNVCK